MKEPVYTGGLRMYRYDRVYIMLQVKGGRETGLDSHSQVT